jgi:hypothetical protein
VSSLFCAPGDISILRRHRHRSGFVESVRSACAVIGYEKLREEQSKAHAEGRLVGIGIATYAELTGIGSRISAAPGMPINTGTESATIRLDSTGAVTGSFGIASHGQGLETTLAQVIADELGARIEDIQILQGDSAVVAHGTGTYASRSAVLAGGAATLASRLLKEKVIRAASHLLEAPVEDIEAADGRVFVGGTDRSLTFREIAKAVYSEMGRLPRDAREELEVTKVYDPYFGTTTSATHIVALEIDPETYEVKLNRYVVAEDCGRMINPMIVDGQVHGAVAQGIGAALYEEVLYDHAGQLLTASLADYVIPTASEVPSITTVHLEAESASTLGGFRGMGEGGTIGAPAAIANALSDALAPLGAEIFELPMTPQRLFRLIIWAKQRLADPSHVGHGAHARWSAWLVAVRVVVHGEIIEVGALPALIAGDRRGLATYRRLNRDAELVTLDADPAGTGTIVVALHRLRRKSLIHDASAVRAGLIGVPDGVESICVQRGPRGGQASQTASMLAAWPKIFRSTWLAPTRSLNASRSHRAHCNRRTEGSNPAPATSQSVFSRC